MNKNLDLCISNLGTVRNNQYQMAILPWGATEPHNLHLPYLTDCILSHSIAVDAAVACCRQRRELYGTSSCGYGCPESRTA